MLRPNHWCVSLCLNQAAHLIDKHKAMNSAFFLAGTSVSSSQSILIFMMKSILYRIKVSQIYFVKFAKQNY